MNTEQPEALRLADALEGNARTAWTREEAAAELRRQHARIVELEAQLEAIGAGGVSGPLIGQPQAPLGGRWYMVNRDGMATLCTDRADAEKEAEDAQSVWPHMGPHRAVQLVEASFDAADMATAAAQGFRDGVASVAASAGSEPVAWPKDATEVREFFRSDFIRAEYVADDHQPCDEDRYYISAHDFLSAINWWADFPHHPSPPKGMAGWKHDCAALLMNDVELWVQSCPHCGKPRDTAPPTAQAEGWTKASEQLPPCRDDQLYIGVNIAGYAGVFNAVASIAGNVHCMYETPEETIDVMSDLSIWKPFNPSPVGAKESAS